MARLSLIVLLLILFVASSAPTPPLRLKVMEGEMTATSEGPGDHVGIQLDRKQWFTVSKDTKSVWAKDQVVGGFMIYGLGDSKLIAKVTYSGAPHVHWGSKHYYARVITYQRVGK